MKIKRRWKILMTAMTLIAVAGVFVGEPTFECDRSVISAADVAWLGYKLIDRLIPMRLDFSQHDEHYGLAHIGERELAEYEEHIREKKNR